MLVNTIIVIQMVVTRPAAPAPIVARPGSAAPAPAPDSALLNYTKPTPGEGTAVPPKGIPAPLAAVPNTASSLRRPVCRACAIRAKVHLPRLIVVRLIAVVSASACHPHNRPRA